MGIDATENSEHVAPPRVSAAHRALADATPTKRGEEGQVQLDALDVAHEAQLRAWAAPLRTLDELSAVAESDRAWGEELRSIASDQSIIPPRGTLVRAQQQDLAWNLEAHAVRVTRIRRGVMVEAERLRTLLGQAARVLRGGCLVEDKEADIEAAVGRLFPAESILLDELTATEKIAAMLSRSLRNTVKNLLDVMRQDHVQSRYNIPTAGNGTFVGKGNDNTPTNEGDNDDL